MPLYSKFAYVIDNMCLDGSTYTIGEILSPHNRKKLLGELMKKVSDAGYTPPEVRVGDRDYVDFVNGPF